MNTFIVSIFLLVTYSLSGYHKPDNNFPKANGVQHKHVDGIRIAWDYSSMQKLASVGTRQFNWGVLKNSDEKFISVLCT